MSVLNVQSLHRLLRQRKDSCPTPAQGVPPAWAGGGDETLIQTILRTVRKDSTKWIWNQPQLWPRAMIWDKQLTSQGLSFHICKVKVTVRTASRVPLSPQNSPYWVQGEHGGCT